LISNAIKFTDSGSVSIVVRYRYNHASIPEDLRHTDPIELPLDTTYANFFTEHMDQHRTSSDLSFEETDSELEELEGIGFINYDNIPVKTCSA
jgi:hypothetical protein